MSTLMICPTCGGVKTTATGAAIGRRCTCSTGGGTATATATNGGAATGTSIAMKVCSVCGADVTDKKRMKDSVTGRYWCYDCYVAEQRKKTSGMTMRCPKCGKDYPPVKMMKHGEAYWCEACHESGGKSNKKKTNAPAPAAAPSGGIVEVSRKPAREDDGAGEKKKPMLYIVLGLMVVAAAAYYYFFMMAPAQ